MSRGSGADDGSDGGRHRGEPLRRGPHLLRVHDHREYAGPSAPARAGDLDRKYLAREGSRLRRRLLSATADARAAASATPSVTDATALYGSACELYVRPRDRRESARCAVHRYLYRGLSDRLVELGLR